MPRKINYLLTSRRFCWWHAIAPWRAMFRRGLLNSNRAANSIRRQFKSPAHGSVVDGLHQTTERTAGAAFTLTRFHYSDVIMSTVASQITGVSIVCSTACWGADKGKHQSSASLAFVSGIHRWPVDSPHKGPVTRKMFWFDDVIMHWKNELSW